MLLPCTALSSLVSSLQAQTPIPDMELRAAVVDLRPQTHCLANDIDLPRFDLGLR